MKQLLILSGKGGTGKTTVAGAFIRLARAKAYGDCDVDAPNLHLIMDQTGSPRKTDYYGMPKAMIHTDLCTSCDLCRQHCRFFAIEVCEGVYEVDPFACEGCSVCQAVCPAGAVTMYPAKTGDLELYLGDEVFSTAELTMGSGNSGKLVSEVKKQLNLAAPDADLVIIDGSPGIGCPVIASLAGIDVVLIVAEPSISGMSDMERILQTAEIFKVDVAVCINKYDTNPRRSEEIKENCKEKGIAFVGMIPYDPQAIQATNDGQSIVDCSCPAGDSVRDVFKETMTLIKKEQ